MIHILFTADRLYVKRIPTVIRSISSCHPGSRFHIHLISDDVKPVTADKFKRFCRKYGYSFDLYRVPDEMFGDAPVNKHYSKAMYYRLLAYGILPEFVDKVLYLDPDILIINSLQELWDTDLDGYLFAAASHTEEKGLLDNINRLRLETSSVYYNTGVLLMNLHKFRESVQADDIFSFIDENQYKLLLPDQDVFNALYGNRTLSVSDEIWNYDTRKYSQYLMRSGGVMDEQWVIRNTSVLHFCGKEKPWHTRYRYRFVNLYRHYENLACQDGWEVYE